MAACQEVLKEKKNFVSSYVTSRDHLAHAVWKSYLPALKEHHNRCKQVFMGLGSGLGGFV